MCRRFSYRNYADSVGSLRVGDHHYPFVEKTKGQETLFSVVESVVEDRLRWAREDGFAVGEIDPVLPEVGPTLAFIPFEYHCSDKCR